MPFFAHVVQKPGDAACQNADVIGAVGAGLALSRGEKPNIAIAEQSYAAIQPRNQRVLRQRLETLESNKQMMCERESDSTRGNVHVPATPLAGSSWVIEALPDQASIQSGAKFLLETVEFSKGWIREGSKAGFSAAVVPYDPVGPHREYAVWQARSCRGASLS